MKTKLTPAEYALAIGLIFLGVSARLLPHPANFAPMGAIAIFSGLILPRRLALWLPLAALLVSDIFLGFYHWPIMLTVYASLLLTTWISGRLSLKFAPVAGLTLLSSIFFFLTTNAAVWGFGTLYTHDLAGLGQSYLMAMPFFRNSLLSDLFFTGLLVGTYFALHSLVGLNKLRQTSSEISQ